eukprot:maker-scaffold_8-snap-gene-10.55-mRNA-1 protein AED:0.27 eAED:0.27 QI:0/0/0/1/0/0/2/0/467
MQITHVFTYFFILTLSFSQTPFPTDKPTPYPTLFPTKAPTFPSPTESPTLFPTARPTISPTPYPTRSPTLFPTDNPTNYPTLYPTTLFPTEKPTNYPTSFPTVSPTFYPTLFPTTPFPTQYPTTPFPTELPTFSPTFFPSESPTLFPTHFPTGSPTKFPSTSPSVAPTDSPVIPTPNPTDSPTEEISVISNTGDGFLSSETGLITVATGGVGVCALGVLVFEDGTVQNVDDVDSDSPTEVPSNSPTKFPTENPTEYPTFFPSTSPTPFPTRSPTPDDSTRFPTRSPTASPTNFPVEITFSPTANPTIDSPITILPPDGETPGYFDSVFGIVTTAGGALAICLICFIVAGFVAKRREERKEKNERLDLRLSGKQWKTKNNEIVMKETVLGTQGGVYPIKPNPEEVKAQEENYLKHTSQHESFQYNKKFENGELPEEEEELEAFYELHKEATKQRSLAGTSTADAESRI